MTAAEQVLPARAGVAMRLSAGDRLRIVNTHGSQVVDLWAMAADDVLESMSMPHSRNPWFRLARGLATCSSPTCGGRSCVCSRTRRRAFTTR